MHSFWHTFAHSSHPIHLYQSITCWPRNEAGSSIFSYGYRRVTGTRPPGTSLLMIGVVWSVCFIVAFIGFQKEPRGRLCPTGGSVRPDGFDFIRVVPAEVRELALRRVHQTALLRLDPSTLLRL